MVFERGVQSALNDLIRLEILSKMLFFHALPSVNVENAKAIGECILEKMEGQKLSDFTFKRKDQAVTLATKNAVKVDGESIQVDTQLLFERLVIAAKTDLESALTYELCTFPKALFETPELLLEAQKSTLADSIWSAVNPKMTSVPENVRFVLDGGALLHRIPWARGSTFGCILKSYTDFVAKNYGAAVIVFDGYEKFSTKDMTHRRRSKGKKGVSVSFTQDMSLTVTKDIFLNDPTNNASFKCLVRSWPMKVARYSMTLQMQICSLSKRQLSQPCQLILP